VSGDGAGLSLINDAKYSYDVRGSDLRLTVLRSPVYAHHDPTKLEPGVSYRCIDQGVQTFRYALLPHSGDWRSAGTVPLADEFNAAPVVWAESGHAGTLPPQSSFARAGDAAVCISALKAAEDGDGWIVRCYETHGRPAGAHIDLPGLHRRWHSHFGPSEIKTFHVPADASQPVREVNLVERSA
jgi:alpha-mannosidase